jgi:hypothetical protein
VNRRSAAASHAAMSLRAGALRLARKPFDWLAARRRRTAANAVERPSSSAVSLLAAAPVPSWRREIALQGVEPVVPGVGERGEKLLGELHGCGPQPVAHPPALARLGRD